MIGSSTFVGSLDGPLEVEISTTDSPPSLPPPVDVTVREGSSANTSIYIEVTADGA